MRTPADVLALTRDVVEALGEPADGWTLAQVEELWRLLNHCANALGEKHHALEPQVSRKHAIRRDLDALLADFNGLIGHAHISRGREPAERTPWPEDPGDGVSPDPTDEED
jgi:hypothetical protein